jgi:hypothetical protein
VEEIYVDAAGNEYTPEQAQYLMDHEGYYFDGYIQDPEPYTPDHDTGFGISDRTMWPDNQTERSQARYAAMQRMLKERSS